MAQTKTIALTGANGMLANMVIRMLPKNYRLLKFTRTELDITDGERVSDVMNEIRPDIILNCAAMTNVDGCESRQEEALSINGVGPGLLADAARENGSILVHVSTDFVFDGAKKTPYVEDDEPHPLSVYGKSKLAGEQHILKSGLERYFIVRTSWLYGPHGNNFVETIARLASEREELRVVADQRGTPTYTRDLARALFALLETKAYGIYHFSNEGECSWFDFANKIVTCLKENGKPIANQRISAISTREYPLPAVRPKYSVLSKKKIIDATNISIAEWENGLRRYFSERVV